MVFRFGVNNWGFIEYTLKNQACENNLKNFAKRVVIF
ncbi:Uncharacterised protein [Streptococcus pneumoniae]|nr:Uncharacterised protein [Streptococcus pneumoniae]VOU49341.1 Uncharacterised protein [Streptococcus pneumoniae]VOV30440.1 Uncharacterised protein [Streptococcus pneumoniae]VOV42202.1 Uncharacterised protein [Streptococcus pneumoniae]VOV46667.1 Uncharacterised protein [Streptococcus pneumoniae]